MSLDTPGSKANFDQRHADTEAHLAAVVRCLTALHGCVVLQRWALSRALLEVLLRLRDGAAFADLAPHAHGDDGGDVRDVRVAGRLRVELWRSGFLETAAVTLLAGEAGGLAAGARLACLDLCVWLLCDPSRQELDAALATAAVARREMEPEMRLGLGVRAGAAAVLGQRVAMAVAAGAWDEPVPALEATAGASGTPSGPGLAVSVLDALLGRHGPCAQSRPHDEPDRPLWLSLPIALAVLPLAPPEDRQASIMALSVAIKSELVVALHDAARAARAPNSGKGVRSTKGGGAQGRPLRPVKAFQWAGFDPDGAGETHDDEDTVDDSRRRQAPKSPASPGDPSDAYSRHGLHRATSPALRATVARIGGTFLDAAVTALACVEAARSEAVGRRAQREQRRAAKRAAAAAATAAVDVRTEEGQSDDSGDWAIVESFGALGATVHFEVEKSETCEALALDSAALLLTELMLVEQRGWELWRTVATRPAADDGDKTMLRALVGMALHRLAGLTAAGCMPPKPSEHPVDEFGTTVLMAGPRPAAQVPAASATAELGASALLRQRDQSVAKLLELVDEYKLLADSSAGIFIYDLD